MVNCTTINPITNIINIFLINWLCTLNTSTQIKFNSLKLKFMKNLHILLSLIMLISSFHFADAQDFSLEKIGNFMVIKKENQILDSIMKNGGEILDYKIINENEIVVIRDIGVNTIYDHIKSENNTWVIKFSTPLGRTPQQRLKYSSSIPKDYLHIKDKFITFIIEDVEKVSIYDGSNKIGNVNFEVIKEKRNKYLEEIKTSSNIQNYNKD